MLRANEPVISILFFLEALVCEIPKTVSILKRCGFAIRCTLFAFSQFPETAAIGDTFAARFAGAPAANSTVIMPIVIPAKIPPILTPKTGIEISHILRDLIIVILCYQIPYKPLKTLSLSQVSFPLGFPLCYIFPYEFTNSDKGKNKGKKII